MKGDRGPLIQRAIRLGFLTSEYENVSASGATIIACPR